MRHVPSSAGPLYGFTSLVTCQSPALAAPGSRADPGGWGHRAFHPKVRATIMRFLCMPYVLWLSPRARAAQQSVRRLWPSYHILDNHCCPAPLLRTQCLRCVTTVSALRF